MISEQTSQLQELRRQLSLREQELREVRRDKESEVGGETERLQRVLREKEAFIKVPARVVPSVSLLARVRLVPHKILTSSGSDAGSRGGDAAVLQRE